MTYPERVVRLVEDCVRYWQAAGIGRRRLEEMRLELTEAEEPVEAGDRVVTSSGSVRFPAGYPVGVVAVGANPSNDTLTTQVTPYVQPDSLRVVVVLAWPPDPITALTPETTTTTSPPVTTIPDDEGSSTTSTTQGEQG